MRDLTFLFHNLSKLLLVSQVACTHHIIMYSVARVSKVTNVVTFGFSSHWMTLLSGGRHFREVVTFGYQHLFVDVKSEHDSPKHGTIIALVFVDFGKISLPFNCYTQPARHHWW